MTDLQILLITIGVILIVIVVLYNGWQDWRARRSMRQTLPEAEHDVLMQPLAERREPVLGGPAVASARSTPEHTEEGPDIDASCEAVIDVSFAHPVAAEQLASAVQGVHQVGKKPVRLFVGREEGGYLLGPRPGEHCVSVHLAVVLANRSGPLTDIEWSHLWALAQGLAESFDGVIEAPEQDQVLQQAAELDSRCAALDAQVGLILQLARPLSLRQIEKIALEAGFVSRAGQLVWPSDSGLPRFSLQADDAGQNTAHRVDLVLDVPNSLPDDQAFSGMLAVGRTLAESLQAEVLDDQGRSFQDASASVIDGQISALYDRLDAAGFLAGSERAARVFS